MAGELCTTTRRQLRRRVEPLNRYSVTSLHRYIGDRFTNYDLTNHELRSQPREQLLMNIVESAVAKNRHDVVASQHRHDSIDNCIRVLFVKCRPPGGRNCIDNCLRL